MEKEQYRLLTPSLQGWGCGNTPKKIHDMEMTWSRLLKDEQEFSDINMGWKTGERHSQAEGTTCT